MVETVKEIFEDLDEEDRARREDLISWISAEAQLPYQTAEDEQVRGILEAAAVRLETELGSGCEAEAISPALYLSRELPGADPRRAIDLLETAAALTASGERIGPDDIAAAHGDCLIL